eukprot:NODE_748_length_1473_cov_66.578652_g619_i0.p1 GENE.NODE_748_length_1473_cov_66.578652_g619_i0~~NODE_748_length_1473_cov_66.578652_g619_i0.p1  ORF type:complete len:288 (+),score=61.98 NODE_748_length_1473_cov_66.578652_g619_i0:299-1162(+)
MPRKSRKQGGPTQEEEDQNTAKGACFRCGQTGHVSRACPTGHAGRVMKAKCHGCGQAGHLRAECPRVQRSGHAKPPSTPATWMESSAELADAFANVRLMFEMARFGLGGSPEHVASSLRRFTRQHLPPHACDLNLSMVVAHFSDSTDPLLGDFVAAEGHYAAVGLLPDHAAEWGATCEEAMEATLGRSDGRVVAVACGVDFTEGCGDVNEQMLVCREHMALAGRHRKPILFLACNADEAALELLTDPSIVTPDTKKIGPTPEACAVPAWRVPQLERRALQPGRICAA